MFVDSHAHLDDEKLRDATCEVIADAKSAGVGVIVNAGCDVPSSQNSVRLASDYPCVYATVGMHPHDSKIYDAEAEQTLVALAKKPKVVAWGEIGLDYHYDLSPRDVQQKVLAAQLEIAASLSLPVVFHVREAYEDFNKILTQNLHYLKNGVLLHCYGGSAELAEYYLKTADAHFSFGGSLTFAKHKAEVLAKLPKERILLETDCPYMTPVPYRGTPNQPKNIPVIAAKMAELMGWDVNEVEQFTTANALRFYGVKL